MNRKSLLILLLLVFISAGVSIAAEKKTGKAVKKSKKIVKLVKQAPSKPILITPKEAPANKVGTVEQESIASVKEEMYKALADMKGQIDQARSDNSGIRVGAQIFFHYLKYTANAGSNVSNFDVDRAYLNLSKKLDWNASARLTLDAARLDTSKLDTNNKSQNLFDFLKYAYVELPINIPAGLQLIPFSLTAKAGLQQTIWTDWQDKILNLRWIAKSLVDNEGVMPSADFGVSALGKISPTFMPEVEYQITLMNGFGYKAPETDNRKNIGMRLNSTVWDGDSLGKVIVGAYGQAAGISADGSTDSTTTKQIGGTVACRNELGTMYGEYLYGTGISGYSIGGIYQLLQGINLFARLDNYDPSRSMAGDQINRSFYGITYDWGKDIKFALDLQNITGGPAASVSAGTTTSIIYFQTQVVI